MPSVFKTLFTWKNFFALFSRVQLAIFAGAFLVSLATRGTDWEAPFSFVAGCTLVVLCLRMAIIIHECGHLAAAVCVSAKPERVTLGLGHEVTRITIGSFKIIINNRPIGGFVVAPLKAKSYRRLRLAVFCFGGVGANLLVAMVLYFLFGMDDPFKSVDFSSALIVANVFLVYNLIPFHTDVYGPRMDSDGLAIAKLFFTRETPIIQTFEYTDGLIAANEMLEQKRWPEAVDALKKMTAQFPEDAHVRINLSLALFKIGEIEQSFAIINAVDEQSTQKSVAPLLGYIRNQKAWMYLEQGNLEQAHANAYRAYALMSRHPSVLGTYGSILIERGDIDQGIKLLLPLADFRFPNSNTVGAAVYLMLGYGLRKNLERAKKYRDFVDSNISHLDRDEKLLYDRCLAKLSDHVEWVSPKGVIA